MIEWRDVTRGQWKVFFGNHRWTKQIIWTKKNFFEGLYWMSVWLSPAMTLGAMWGWVGLFDFSSGIRNLWKLLTGTNWNSLLYRTSPLPPPAKWPGSFQPEGALSLENISKSTRKHGQMYRYGTPKDVVHPWDTYPTNKMENVFHIVEMYVLPERVAKFRSCQRIFSFLFGFFRIPNRNEISETQFRFFETYLLVYSFSNSIPNAEKFVIKLGFHYWAIFR